VDNVPQAKRRLIIRFHGTDLSAADLEIRLIGRASVGYQLESSNPCVTRSPMNVKSRTRRYIKA